MKRREFLELLPAGAFAGAAALKSGSLAAAAELAPIPPAHWMDNGIIDAGGIHETYLFMVRRGGQRLDARKQYEFQQSEETIRGLKNSGVEVFHTHLYKGFGMAAEAPEMQDTVKAAAFAHSIGMKVDTYIQWDTMMYETFFAEVPAAKDWVQLDAEGRHIRTTYGYQQSFRYRPCIKNQNYLDYIKKVVKFGIQEVKTDFIHFDNFDLNAEPDSCHCPVCVKGFRDHLRSKYNDEQRKERFGFANIDYVNPPEWNVQNPPEKMQIIFDPGIQEWIDFRCQVMADGLNQVAAYAKSLNPEVVIEINPHGITGGNRCWEAGLDHARLLPNTQVFWTEDRNEPGVESDGRLISKIRSYKLARTFKNVLFTYNHRAELNIAECLAFNQTLGWGGIYPLTPIMRKYIDFYRTNRKLFNQSRDLSDVAVLRSYASITYNHSRCQLSAFLAEQALIEGAVPFDIVFDQHLKNLAAYRVLVLPDSECLSDAEIESIQRFVNNGGGLVAIGSAGLYDQWRRARPTPGLANLVDVKVTARGYEENVQRIVEDGQDSRKQVGRGRVCYLPALRFDGTLPQFGNYYRVDARFWKNPANAGQFLDGLAWARNGDASVQVQGPKHLIANAATVSPRLSTVHLVNYLHSPAGEVTVTCRNPGNTRALAVSLYSPDFAESRKVQISAHGATTSFKIPQMNTYMIATVEWA